MPQNTSLSSMIVPYAIIIGIFYFLVFRPEQQRKKKMKLMLDNLKKNDEVVMTSGIHGTVVIVKDKTVVVRVDEGSRIEFDREAIASVKADSVKPEVIEPKR